MFDSILRAISRSQSESNINNQVKLYNDTLPTLVNSEIEEVVNNISTFEEAFPNYDPNETIFPVRVVKYIYEYFSNVGSNTIREVESTSLSEEITKNSLNSVYSSSDRPLGVLGDYTLNESLTYLLSFHYTISVFDYDINIYPIKLIFAGLLYKTVIESVRYISNNNNFNQNKKNDF